MSKIHLLMRKEEIDSDKMLDNKLAVIFDVLLATSTITSGLYFGAKEVIPVLNGEEAVKESLQRQENSYVLVGEYEGKTIEGFLDPNPLTLREKIAEKTMILSTTNGTVAIRKAASSKKVFIGSLLNAAKLAEVIDCEHNDETVVIICSGTSGEFCLEDFYGAGCFLDFLLNHTNKDWELTDSSLAALYFYRGNKENGENLLLATHVGSMLKKYGYEKEVEFISKVGIMGIVPYLHEQVILPMY
ncbi:2-phosphosulfolactate phosphatase [Cytobacillus sp. IB215316]|uniref:2-phosphosulfolactate phosphatase n=1 Tax=Cytobacillus sp. IB215316 TaxID=3097354 RepID=UPI002A0EB0C0|nr:2-phosphosulfolactate phosphatase [Cytobacillus sp. IB215316]MDX8360537.1 2-phosphosulfolactate phosphatase [Cytobacillus sp. IB215316]